MNHLIERFSEKIKGWITGFDRIVFKGWLMPIINVEGAQSFCRSNGILNKDYKKWMLQQTAELTKVAEEYARSHCGGGIIPIPSCHLRKEELAHNRQKEKTISKGLIGVWSCLEGGSSFRAFYCSQMGYPQLKYYSVRCKHLYYYFDHEEFGFMNIRLQTWFPYHIQVCLNGREWLRRQLEKEGIDFVMQKNKFLHLSDYKAAQAFLDAQLDARWTDILNSFLPIAFPTMTQTLGPYLSYYWTMWQSEWATDLIFNTPKSLNAIMDSLLRHAIMTGTSMRLLRYMDRPITKEGKPYIRSNDDVLSRVLDFNDGCRVKHWIDKNSIKVYNEQNVLRVETTINQPDKFHVHRNKQGQSKSETKKRMPIRKGVADVALRAKVSQEINDRFMNDLAELKNNTPVSDLFCPILKSKMKKGSRIRALDPTGKDRELLQAISDPSFRISGFTNKMLKESLQDTHWVGNRTDKQITARISRHLRLLRHHGLIRKLPNQHRYQLTILGVRISTTLNAMLAASTEQLMGMAA